MKKTTLLLITLFFTTILPLQANIRTIQVDTVPFEIRADNRIYVHTHINGNVSKTFTFLVDTGASDIVLNSSLPEVMKMARFDTEVVNQGPTSKESIPATHHNQTIQVGKNRLNGVRFIAIPYPPTAWDGVLGLSFMRNYEVSINYDRKEMYLSPKGTTPVNENKATSFEFIAGVPVISTLVSINGKCHTLKVELDSGSDRVFDINTPYVERHQLRGTLPVFAISTISGTSSSAGRLENVCFDYAEIGGTRFPLLPGAFSTVRQGLQSTSTFDGVIGNNLLQRFNQTWDFKHNKLYLTPNHRFYTPFYDFLIAR